MDCFLGLGVVILKLLRSITDRTDELLEDRDLVELYVFINLFSSGVTGGNPLSNDLDC